MIEYMQYLGFWTPGPVEIIVILVVLLLVFGRRLPEIARNIGKSLTELKKGMREVEETKDEIVDDVRKAGNEVAEQTKDTTGPNEENTPGTD